MKVLSIKEPYATLICNGKKLIETRSWNCSTEKNSFRYGTTVIEID